jgi:hypothetical protein
MTAVIHVVSHAVNLVVSHVNHAAIHVLNHSAEDSSGILVLVGAAEAEVEVGFGL